MKSKLSAIFFLLIFSALITAPTIIVAIDNSFDITCFYNITEEEEESGHQISKEGKMFYVASSQVLNQVNGIEKNGLYAYCFKKYSKPYVNLVSPPPEFNS